jgi:hypothetical protein
LLEVEEQDKEDRTPDPPEEETTDLDMKESRDLSWLKQKADGASSTEEKAEYFVR